MRAVTPVLFCLAPTTFRAAPVCAGCLTRGIRGSAVGTPSGGHSSSGPKASPSSRTSTSPPASPSRCALGHGTRSRRRRLHGGRSGCRRDRWGRRTTRVVADAMLRSDRVRSATPPERASRCSLKASNSPARRSAAPSLRGKHRARPKAKRDRSCASLSVAGSPLLRNSASASWRARSEAP